MPSVYGRVFTIGFYGQEFIAISMILRQRVYSNVHSRLSLTISHDFSSRYVYLFTAFNYEPLRALGACFLGSCSRLLAIQDVMAMFLLNFRPFRPETSKGFKRVHLEDVIAVFFLRSGTSKGTLFVFYMDVLFYLFLVYFPPILKRKYILSPWTSPGQVTSDMLLTLRS
jgi:hypothetical protein